MTDPRRPGRLVVALSAAAAGLLLLAIWGPWFAYNHVPDIAIASAVVEESRRVPDDGVLEEVGRHDLGVPLSWSSPQSLVDAAEKLVRGRVELPGYPSATFVYPLTASTMASGSTRWQLFVHCFGLPRVLLEAYRATRREEFLAAAADYVAAYDAYERSGWRRDGYLWNDRWKLFVRNDHAISARALVLADFWSLYRHRPTFSRNVATVVLRMAARYSSLLTDPRRFTVETNHGVMQNLAMCVLGLAFPALPGGADLCQLASARLDEQFTFFISDEGFILEHSPAYQSLDLTLIGLTFRALSLAQVPIPSHWLRKYRAAQHIYEELRRPDGSLPVVGDTYGVGSTGPAVTSFDDRGRAALPGTRTWSASEVTVLAPVSGYCVWWDGLGAWPAVSSMSQTTIAWSYFPGMGHKHADEMSVDVWAGGTSWWLNVGYWPYDDPHRSSAESWNGANAPHLVGEPSESERQTELRYHGTNARLAAIDLERAGPDRYRARRQVVRVGPGTWLVVDTSSGVDDGRTRTTWTTSPSVRLTDVGAGDEYLLTDGASGRTLRAFFTGARGTERRMVLGSHSPFAGWSAIGGVIQPAPAIVVERPVDGAWTLAAWSIDVEGRREFDLAGAPRMDRWRGADDWSVVFTTSAGPVTLQRHETRFDLYGSSLDRLVLELRPGPGVATQRASLAAALSAASEKYGTAEMSAAYRAKVTAVLLAALLLCVGLFEIARRNWPHWRRAIGRSLIIGWLLLCYFLLFVRVPLF